MAKINSVDFHALKIRGNLRDEYRDVYTPEALDAIAHLAPLNEARRELMADRLQRRGARARECRRIAFLNPRSSVPGTPLTVEEARLGKFTGGDLPADLRRQWVQGTGPATRPGAPPGESLRPVAFGLLSGADGWIFDGEDAQGQASTMSLDGQRHLKLAFAGDPLFLRTADQVAAEINAWNLGFLGRPAIADWHRQLEFTTRIFRPRGLHLDDRHIRTAGKAGLSASIVDLVLYVANNHKPLRRSGRTLAIYLPKIQTAGEAAFWNRLLVRLEEHLSLPADTLRTYVLIEQLEASFQLMEIRAALGRRFIGFSLGRWDYINSVADAMAWNPEFILPNFDTLAMTHGILRICEDRVRRAAATPDLEGRAVPWLGGTEPHTPAGSEAGVSRGMKRAIAGAEREWREGASGKWVAHWKMVRIIRSVWEKAGQDHQLGRRFPPLTYTADDAENLLLLEPAPRTVRGARELISVGLQFANAFGQGLQRSALKPADHFDNVEALCLKEDMATAESRLSILWEWLHKGATFTEADGTAGVAMGSRFTGELFARLLREEFIKLIEADDRNVSAVSKDTTLPVAREVVRSYVTFPTKVPWFIDLLNINLDNHDLERARRRIGQYLSALVSQGVRITENPDFESSRLAPG